MRLGDRRYKITVADDMKPDVRSRLEADIEKVADDAGAVGKQGVTKTDFEGYPITIEEVPSG